MRPVRMKAVRTKTDASRVILIGRPRCRPGSFDIRPDVNFRPSSVPLRDSARSGLAIAAAFRNVEMVKAAEPTGQILP